MKTLKNYFSLKILVLVFIPIQFFAQNIELVPFAGFSFKSTLKNQDFNTVIKPGFIYGGTLNYKVDNLSFGISASNINTTAKIISRFDKSFETSSFIVSNLSLSGVNNHEFDDNLSAYYGIELGLINFRNANTGDDNLKGSIGLKAGLAYKLNDRISLRIQPQLTSTLDGIGLGVGFGSGGLSLSTASYSNYMQFNLTGGIIIALNKQSKK